MDYRRFEREFLKLAFTTPIELTPSSLAFFTGCTIEESERHMQRLVSHGVLELTSDDDGHIKYEMPDRPEAPIAPRWSAAEPPPPYPDPPYQAPPRAIVVRDLRTELTAPTPNQAVAGMFLNALVCPGIGSLVGGRTRTGMAQLSMFLVGIPLVVVAIGLPMIVAAWTWGIATGAQMIAESRQP